MELLFSYGTLQLPNVQMETFSRLLKGEEDILMDYELGEVVITDTDVLKKSRKAVHPIAVPQKKGMVKGMVFELSAQELKHSDQYEVSDYKRIQAKLKSGKMAWVYVKAI